MNSLRVWGFNFRKAWAVNARPEDWIVAATFTAWPYTSRHLDWYMSTKNMREEDEYYFTAKGKEHWGWGHKFYDEVYKK